MHRFPLIPSLLFAGLLSAPSLAQNASSAIQQSQEVQRRQQLQQTLPSSTSSSESSSLSGTEKVPEVIPGEVDDTGPQYIVRTIPRREWVEVSVDTQYYYTSNIFLQEESETGTEANDTALWVSTASFAIAPDPFEGLGGQWAPKVGFKHQWYVYGLDQTKNGYNNFDFDSQTLFAETRYTFLNDWTASAGFEWNRLLQHEPPLADYNELYKAYIPKWGLERRFNLTDESMFSIAYAGSFHYTNVDPNPRTIINDRHEQSITLSYTHMPIENFMIQPFYRFLYTGYDVQLDTTYGHTRKDYLHTGGLTLMYFFNKWASVRAFFTYDHKESDDVSIADYRKWDGGTGGSLVFRF